jgi:hypothetical protein
MNVKQLVDMLSSIPGDAHVVATSDPMRKDLGPWVVREGEGPEENFLFHGFSAEELRMEEFEVFFFDKANIVCIGLVRNSKGEEV